jgi:hypothetical protein
MIRDLLMCRNLMSRDLIGDYLMSQDLIGRDLIYSYDSDGPDS